MVYAIRSNNIIISCRPLKGTRRQGEQSKQEHEFAESHTVYIQTDSKGKIAVKAKEK